MGKLFVNIFQMSISASYLILAVLLVRFLLRKAPKSMRSFLWLLVGIRLLFPFSVESVFSLIPSTRAVDEYIYDINRSEINTIPETTDIDTPASQPIQDTYVPSMEKNRSKAQSTVLICTKIWLLGVALMVSYMLISWLHLKKRVKISVPVDIALDCGHVKIYQSDTIESPFLFGIIRPRIYIPDHIAGEELPYVILHEMTHRKRKDHLIKPVAFLLLSVYWFNPCVWGAYIMLCKDIELICDEQVIRQLGMSCKREYSQALLNSAVNRRMIAACPIAFGEVSVKERVKNVLNYKKPAFWGLVAAVLACIIVPACFMTYKKGDGLEERKVDAIDSANSEDLGAEEIDLDDIMLVGEYEMINPDQDKYLFVPRLDLSSDGKFTFSYDSLSSYLSYGDYEQILDRVKAVTDDGRYHYQFTQIGYELLRFDADDSSDVSRINEALSTDAPLENGSIFFRNKARTAIGDAETMSYELIQEFAQGTTMTSEELMEKQNLLAEMMKRLTIEEMRLKKQLESVKYIQLEPEEITALESRLQELSQELDASMKKLEESQAACQSVMEAAENTQTAYNVIEQWARAFCDRDGETIIKLADEKLEQKLVDDDLLLHGFDGEKDYVTFGWSSPWPWGSNYEEETNYNYRIINVTGRSAEILYYAWVSNPHVTVWREVLTYTVKNDKYVINSEELQFMDAICTAEEFRQAYPDGITGTMMDYYTCNNAGEALNDHAVKNPDNDWYGRMLEPDTAAVCLLNILDDPGKVGVRVRRSASDASTCTVAFEFHEDGSSVNVQMIQPYGSDGIWVPRTEQSAAPTDGNTDTASIAPYVITDENVDDIIEEDARQLEALFPDHHEFAWNAEFPQTVDLNGDGVAEKIEMIDLRYNGGDGGYALRVTDMETGQQIPLPDGYTEENGFPIFTSYIRSEGEDSRLLIQLGDEEQYRVVATIMQGPLFRIYERNHMYFEVKNNFYTKESILADALSGCNIITYNNETTPVLLLKTYISGYGGHVDTLGYVITELRLRRDNTWDSRHYFLLDSCDDPSIMQLG